MSQQNDVRIVTGVEVDKKSIRDGERAYDRIGKAAQDSARQIRDIGREQERIVREFRDGNRTFEDASRAIKELGGSYEDTKRSLVDLRNEQERLNRTQERRARAAEFGERQGERASQFGRTRGGIEDIAALAGIDTSGLSAILQAAEGISDLGEAAGKAASGISGLAGALVGGIGIAGAFAAVQIATFAAKEALAAMNAEREREAELLGLQLDAALSLDEQIAAGTITREDAIAREEELAAVIGVQEGAIQGAIQGFAQYREEFLATNLAFGVTIQDVSDGISGLAVGIVRSFFDPIVAAISVLPRGEQIARPFLDAMDAIEDGIQRGTEQRLSTLNARFGGGEGSALLDFIDATGTKLDKNTAEANEYNTALDENAFAANDAAAAEQMLADTRLSAAEAELNAQRNLNSQLATLTTEQIETRLRAAQIELEAQRQLLAGLEDIERVSQQNIITGLEAEIDALSDALDSDAVAANDAAKAAEEAAEELEKMKTATDGVAESTRRAGLSLGGWSEAAKEAFEELQAAAEEAENEITRIHERRLELVTDFNQREAEIIKQNLFDRNQAHERFLFDEERLLGKGMFTEAFRARQEQAFSNEQTGERLQFEQSQRSDSLTREIEKLAVLLEDMYIAIDISTNPLFDAEVSSTSRTIAARTVNRTTGRRALRPR